MRLHVVGASAASEHRAKKERRRAPRFRPKPERRKR
jgi:hypothetical protein